MIRRPPRSTLFPSTPLFRFCWVDEYDADIVRKHERRGKEREDDRTRHMLALRAQTGPVFLTYRGRDEINDLAIRAQQKEPLYDFAADGVTHTIWRVSPADTDRKSTRLNSSHSHISHAVFCFKKKQ